MKILFLMPQLPFPPSKGTSIRNFHILKNLALDHSLTLLSFGDERDSANSHHLPFCDAVELVEIPQRSHLARLADVPFPDRPDLVRRLKSSIFAGRLRALLEREVFDLVQIEGLEMAQHWELVAHRAAANGSARMPSAILDDHNAEYVLQRRAYEIDRGRPSKWVRAAYSLIQWRKLARFERRFARLVSGVVAASDTDRGALLKLDGRLRVGVVPNGVDTSQYRAAVPALGEAPRLVFIGTMDFRPNIDGVRWFCDRVWPGILQRMPDAQFWIVGRGPGPSITKLADGKTVFVTGAVEDVAPYLATASLAVVPLRIGGGSRLKVLEAMAAGVPVVSTTLGCEGIRVSDETAVLADEPRALVDAVCAMLRDHERTRRLSVAARQLVEREYDWKVIVPRLAAFHREVLAS